MKRRRRMRLTGADCARCGWGQRQAQGLPSEGDVRFVEELLSPDRQPVRRAARAKRRCPLVCRKSPRMIRCWPSSHFSVRHFPSSTHRLKTRPTMICRLFDCKLRTPHQPLIYPACLAQDSTASVRCANVGKLVLNTPALNSAHINTAAIHRDFLRGQPGLTHDGHGKGRRRSWLSVDHAEHQATPVTTTRESESTSVATVDVENAELLSSQPLSIPARSVVQLSTGDWLLPDGRRCSGSF